MLHTDRNILQGNKTTISIIVLLLLGLILVHNFLHSDQSHYSNPDEIIVVEVVKNLNKNTSLDANWALADLPAYFKYDQYNFTSYIYFVYLAQKIASVVDADVFTDDNAYKFTRSLSAISFSLMIFVVFILAKKFMPTGYAFLASVITLFSIQLQQDALYARPESFFSLLVIIICLLLTRTSQRPKLIYSLVGFILGILLACKISALFLGPFIAILLIIQYKHSLLTREPLMIASLLGGATLLGFIIGNPYIIFNFDGWVNGVMYLLGQYSSAHLPHGLHDASVFGRIQHSFTYLFSTNGIILAFFIVGTIYALVKKNFLLCLFCTMVILHVIYFSIKPVFFERNISHLIPLLYIIAVFGIASTTSLIHAKKTRIALVLVLSSASLFIPIKNITLLKTSITPHLEAHNFVKIRDQLRASYSSESIFFGYLLSSSEIDSLLRKAKSSHSLLYEINDPGDIYTQKNIEELLQAGYFSIAWRHEGIFSEFPASTLQTYLNNGTIFLLKNEKKLQLNVGGFEMLNDGQWQNKDSGLSISIEGSWQLDGYYSETPAPVPADGQISFGSWNGSDSNRGQLTISIPDDRCKTMNLSYFNGPDSTGLEILVINSHTTEVLNRLNLNPFNNEWNYVTSRALFKDSDCKNIAIVANDNGTNWGQWLAITLHQ